MKRTASAILSACLLTSAGCHSAYVEANVHNATGADVTLLEVDYPSASFGKETLAADSDLSYRFKILGSGGTKITWTDAAHHEHEVTGPTLTEGQEGTLSITLRDSTASWEPHLKP